MTYGLVSILVCLLIVLAFYLAPVINIFPPMLIQYHVHAMQEKDKMKHLMETSFAIITLVGYLDVIAGLAAHSRISCILADEFFCSFHRVLRALAFVFS